MNFIYAGGVVLCLGLWEIIYLIIRNTRYNLGWIEAKIMAFMFLLGIFSGICILWLCIQLILQLGVAPEVLFTIIALAIFFCINYLIANRRKKNE